jgi:RNA polymerase sigma factor (TIGR02999 family)
MSAPRPTLCGGGRHNASMLPEPGSGSPPDTELYAAVERELHAIAARLLRGERASHTLQATALMHEAWLRLARVHQPWQDHGHFVCAAAGTMRRVLVEHARARGRDKRGAGAHPVTLSTDIHGAAAAPEDVLVVDDALQRLAALDAELAEIVELRVFGGLGHRQIAEATGRSLRSVERGWRLARAFLRRLLGDADAP